MVKLVQCVNGTSHSKKWPKIGGFRALSGCQWPTTMFLSCPHPSTLLTRAVYPSLVHYSLCCLVDITYFKVVLLKI